MGGGTNELIYETKIKVMDTETNLCLPGVGVGEA